MSTSTPPPKPKDPPAVPHCCRMPNPETLRTCADELDQLAETNEAIAERLGDPPPADDYRALAKRWRRQARMFERARSRER